jgi:hypothetical protein
VPPYVVYLMVQRPIKGHTPFLVYAEPQKRRKQSTFLISFLLCYAHMGAVLRLRTVASHPFSSPIGLRAVNLFSGDLASFRYYVLCRLPAS